MRARCLRIACLGGGLAGLATAIAAKRRAPEWSVEVWERNAGDAADPRGFLLSDGAVAALWRIDPSLYGTIVGEAVESERLQVVVRDRSYRVDGHKSYALPRSRLLALMRQRALELGAAVYDGTDAPDPDELPEHDIIVGADGSSSTVRERLAESFRPSVVRSGCKFAYFIGDHRFDVVTHMIEETPQGVVSVYSYPFNDTSSVYIASTRETSSAPGGEPGIAADRDSSDLNSRHYARLLANRDGAGARNWSDFDSVSVERLVARNVVLVGDAAHTVHFSIGSPAAMAMADAHALVDSLLAHPRMSNALAAYEAARLPAIAGTQRAADASRRWFEELEQYVGQHDLQLVFNFLTRSRRTTYRDLRRRDHAFVSQVDRWFANEVATSLELTGRLAPRPPMFMPFRLRGLELENRVVVSAMDMCSAVDGYIDDFHLVHLGMRALGGAALVMSEMICVTPAGRMTPGCAGLWEDDQVEMWRRLVGFVHQNTSARVGVQLGHAGRKGSTQLLWEAFEHPLESGNWEVLAPSAIPYFPDSQVPREMADEDFAAVAKAYTEATLRAERAGFDILELHMAHGYLLSSFLTPLSNRRKDRYGGSLENRMRFPLEVFEAVRAAWPAEKPISVKVSATDWVPGGFDCDDAVIFARALKHCGCDIINVSAGRTSPEARPPYGRTYQTPLSDAVRNRVGIPTIAVGAITHYDDVNSMVLAGRADLCALAKAHLYDPAWTLHAAAEQDYDGAGASWPIQYRKWARRPVTEDVDPGVEASCLADAQLVAGLLTAREGSGHLRQYEPTPAIAGLARIRDPRRGW